MGEHVQYLDRQLNLAKREVHRRESEPNSTRGTLASTQAHLKEERRKLEHALSQSRAKELQKNVSAKDKEIAKMHSKLAGEQKDVKDMREKVKLFLRDVEVEKENLGMETNRVKWAILILAVCIATAGFALWYVLRSRSSYAHQVQHHLGM